MRVRFAPVPSGDLHLGSAKVALANYLTARRYGGQFLLRFEDTDPKISQPEFEPGILATLKWLGLAWDGGAGRRLAGAPARQRDRASTFAKAARRLVAEGKAYYCFCSRDEWLARAKAAGYSPVGELLRYDGACRRLSRREIKERLAAGEPAAVRLAIRPGPIVFEDLIKGRLSFEGSLFGDFIILRSDGTPLYNFACAADDWWSGIDLVIRGDDHLSNVPKQILVWEALGAPIPRMAHLPLLQDEGGGKLSKRTGSAAVLDWRRRGLLPEGVLVYLYTHGLGRLPAQELLRTMGEGPPDQSLDRLLAVMARDFDWSRVGRAPSRVVPGDLEEVSRAALAALPLEERVRRAAALAREKGVIPRLSAADRAAAEGVAAALADRPRDLVDLALDIRAALFGPLLSPAAAAAAVAGPDAAPRDLRRGAAQIRSFARAILRHGGLPADAILASAEGAADPPSGTMPAVRGWYGRLVTIALFGRRSGPPLQALLSALPPRIVAKRLRALAALLEGRPAPVPDTAAIESAQVAAYSSDQLRRSVGAASPLPGFRNRVWRVDTARGAAVVKIGLTGSPWNALQEFRALQALVGSGAAPTHPRLDLTRERFPAAVQRYDWVEGAPITILDPAMAAALGRTVAVVHGHAPPSPGGGLPDAPDRPLEQYRSVVAALSTYLKWRDETGQPADGLVDRLVAAVAALEPWVRQAEAGWTAGPPALLHGDLRLSNMIRTADGGIVLIDWESAVAGDPAWDLGWMLALTEPDAESRERLWAAYGAGERLRARAETMEILALAAWPFFSLTAALRLLMGTDHITASLLPYVRAEHERLRRDAPRALAMVGARIGRPDLAEPLPEDAGEHLLPVLPSPQRDLIVAVEGPASSLKSEVASRLAWYLEGVHLSAGLLFRAYALLASEGAGPPDAATLASVHFEPLDRYPYGRVLAGARDVTPRLYDPAVEEAVAAHAGSAQVQEWAAALLRRAAPPGRPVVADGRRVASELLVGVQARIVVDASLENRARRKADQWRLEGRAVTDADALHSIARRDAQDAANAVAPAPALPTMELDASRGAEALALEALRWLAHLPACAPLASKCC